LCTLFSVEARGLSSTNPIAAPSSHARKWLVKTSFCHKTYQSNDTVCYEFIPQWMLCMWKASERSSVPSSTVKCSHHNASPPLSQAMIKPSTLVGKVHCDCAESAQVFKASAHAKRLQPQQSAIATSRVCCTSNVKFRDDLSKHMVWPTGVAVCSDCSSHVDAHDSHSVLNQ